MSSIRPSNLDEDTHAALLKTSSLCTVALGSLRDPPTATTSTPASAHALVVLRTDFVSLLALLRSHVLSLSLALKPPITSDAVHKTVSQFNADLGRLTNCALSVDDEGHGVEIRKQIRWAAEEVLEGAQRFVLGFAGQPSLPTLDVLEDAEGEKRDLVPTASLLSTIDRIRHSLPEDNRAAIVKRWEADAGALQDGVREAREMIEDGDNESEDAVTKDEEQTGWDALDAGFAEDKLAGEDLERAKMVYPLLRLITLLHRRLLTHHLALEPSLPMGEGYVSSLCTISTSLVAASDEVIASFYTPQDVDALRRQVLQIGESVSGLRRAWEEWDTQQGLERIALDIADGGFERQTDGMKETNGRWFSMCFVQIDKVIKGLEQALSTP